MLLFNYLDHGGVGARAEAFDLSQREQTIRSGLALLNVQVLLDGLLDLLRATHHARCRAAQLF